ncbi:hypothetical protein B0J13DRAFT_534496 [Dactylonectria estremocensis]|uniref:DUF7703 domain-containing protein n=1 Tax=Dactylonectria estremocensis TaxID=1079267 RepID=A0A9P9D184_9HYPO|nr:hypothetical protein B0J13DRAFT_534496 [Dactylonectria estremocensis]
MSSLTRGDSYTRQAVTHAVYSPEDVLVFACSTLALYNSVELLSLISMTFKRRSGLYFWSILFASFGIIPYCVGWMIVYFDFTHDYVGMIIDSIGWVLLISGQSVVLYSRLHLVVNDTRILRATLWMVVCNGVVWHTSITVLLFGSTYSPHESKKGFNAVFNVLEKVQMTCFCVQEFIISGLYIWKTVDILKTAFGNTRRIIWQLFAINIVIVIMDIALLAIEYKNFYVWQQGCKVVVYSIKLKLEFAVLGQLIHFVQNRQATQSGDPSNRNPTGFVEISRDKPSKSDKMGTLRSRTDTMHLEDLSAERATVVTVPKATPHSEVGRDEICIMARIDVESADGMDPRDDRSTDELCGHTMLQLSTSR